MLKKYKKFYTDSKMKNKLTKLVKRISSKAFRQIITLFVMFKSKEVPVWAKVSIIGVLGYLICPIDLIPDFFPTGLIDDLAAISILLSEISVFTTNEIEAEVEAVIEKFNVSEAKADSNVEI